MLANVRRCTLMRFTRNIYANTGRIPCQTLVESTVQDYMINCCQISSPTEMLLCVSGGCDSMALMHIMGSIHKRVKFPLNISVVHFNHKVRSESDDEALFVAGAASEHGFKCFLRTIPSDLSMDGGFQAAARDWRRSTCLDILKDWQQQNEHAVVVDSQPVQYVYATAHHKNDQVETMLLKLFRGTHISNLFGMLPRSDMGIKPLLPLKKSQLVEYMTEKGLNWMEDNSNEKRDYKRNRIRLDLVPLLEDLSGGEDALIRRVSDLSVQSSELKDHLQSEALAYCRNEMNMNLSQPTNADSYQTVVDIQYRSDKFIALGSLLQAEVIHVVIQHVTRSAAHPRVTVSYKMIHRIRHLLLTHRRSEGSLPKSVQLHDGWRVTAIGTVLRLHHACDRRRSELSGDIGEIAADRTPIIVTPTPIRNISISHIPAITVKVEDAAEVEKNASEMAMPFNFVDDTNGAGNVCNFILHNIPPNAVIAVRCAAAGDAFKPSWRKRFAVIIVKVKDFLRSQKVPLHRRNSCCVVELDSKVVAIPPYVAADHCSNNGTGLTASIAVTISTDHCSNNGLDLTNPTIC